MKYSFEFCCYYCWFICELSLKQVRSMSGHSLVSQSLTPRSASGIIHVSACARVHVRGAHFEHQYW